MQDLMLYAKSLATSQGQPLWLEIIPSESVNNIATWQVILHQGEPFSDGGGDILRTISGQNYTGIVMQSGIVTNRLLIEGQYGKIGNGHLRFYWREVPEHVIKVISSYGASRVRSCSVGRPLMDIRHVKLPLGMTLVALLITTALSSLLLLTVTELFASQVQITARLTQRIQLQQQLSSVLQLMQKDLRRAGFNRERDQSVVFDQASSSVDVSQPDRLGYLYRVATSGNRQFRQVVYQLSADSLLLICEKYSASPLTITEASQSTQENPCFSL
ncbi:hypothetical protein P4S72_05845 [Vibrio sp. PP-XX7]